MALLKKKYVTDRLHELSEKVLNNLETCRLFREASCVAFYHALPDEVQTAAFIRKWHQEKNILLPVVEKDDLHLVPYQGEDALTPGAFGILEPAGKECDLPLSDIDLIIVPGVAFDRKNNRLGRGKGYYDRLLATLDIPKIGICFDFQLLDEIPAEPFDQKMDAVITETQTADRF